MQVHADRMAHKVRVQPIHIAQRQSKRAAGPEPDLLQLLTQGLHGLTMDVEQRDAALLRAHLRAGFKRVQDGGVQVPLRVRELA